VRVTVLHNPSAGDEEHRAEAIRAVIREAGHEVSYRSVDDDGWDRVLEQPADLVAVAGGDGTVQEVMRQLAGKPFTLTLLPLGSANNIATSLGIVETDIERLVAGWPGGRTRTYDIGNVSAPGVDACFVESVGGGLFAAAIERGEARESDHEDKVTLGLELLRELIQELPAQPWRLELDGRDRSGEFVGVEAMTVGETGPAVALAPDTDPGDGCVDVLTIGDRDRAGVEAYVARRLNGGDAALPQLRTERARTVRLVPPDGTALRIDDETFRLPADRAHGEAVVVTARRHTVQLLLPA
jgi:diacylglycerol kinase family enzyme